MLRIRALRLLAIMSPRIFLFIPGAVLLRAGEGPSREDEDC
jgi:hypothetical protein